MHPSLRTPRSASSASGVALVAGVVTLLLAPASEAQVLSRLSGRLEGGGTILASSPQSADFGLGFGGRLDLAVRVAGPLQVHAFGAYNVWPASDSAAQNGNAASAASTLLGGGLGFEPALTPRFRLRAEADLAASFNGAESATRFSWGVGIGAWFGVSRVFDIGPIVRLGSILASDEEQAGGSSSAYFINFGIALSLHGPEPEPVAAAVIEPVPVVVQPAPVAPPAATVTTTVAPSADPLGYSTTTTTTTTVPPATAVTTLPGPGAQVAPQEEQGRHGRRGRHRRRGGGGSRRHRRH